MYFQMNPPEYTSLPKRFWDKVEVNEETGCWEWTATRSSIYGRFQLAGKLLQAHRVSAADFYGPVPEGMHALHHCDIERCVNPKHIYYGTNQDNSDDRGLRGLGIRGERNGTVKLTAANVLEIRKLAKNHTQRYLGNLFGVTQANIQYITSRSTWTHI